MKGGDARGFPNWAPAPNDLGLFPGGDEKEPNEPNPVAGRALGEKEGRLRLPEVELDGLKPGGFEGSVFGRSIFTIYVVSGLNLKRGTIA